MWKLPLNFCTEISPAWLIGKDVLSRRLTKQTTDTKTAEVKNQSTVHLLRGKITFTNEPLWYRIIIVLSIIVFLVAMAWALKEWALPYLGITNSTDVIAANVQKLWISVKTFRKDSSP
jgi:type III secretory pathway component EscU